MKKLITLLITALLTLNVFSQITAPQTMSYQAVVRNSSNTLVKNSRVGVKISILDGSVSGAAVYVETHLVQTNENGLLNLEIGRGNVVTGNYYSDTYWGQIKFLKTEIDPLGGVNYTITSTSPLLSVPVSNYAHISGVSNSLWGYAWDFVGAYLQINLDISDYAILQGYSYITYIGINKVMWTFTLPYIDHNSNGIQEEDEVPQIINLYGTVVGNVVTFKSQSYGGTQNTQELIGTKVGNNLTLTDNGNVIFVLVKE